jgi:hypothetical protein
MELAILLVPCHLAAFIARKPDRLTAHCGELIDSGGTQRIFGFIQNGKKAIAVHHFKRMTWIIGVCSDVVCRLQSGGLLRFEPAREPDPKNRKHRQTRKMPEVGEESQFIASSLLY